MKRRLFLLMALFFMVFVACGVGNEIPTRVPVQTIPGTETPDESPRIGPGAELPPTWTPVPTAPIATPALVGEDGAGGTGENETYTIQPGDTLAEIAQAFGVTVNDLVEANNIENIDVIEVNDVLIIPR